MKKTLVAVVAITMMMPSLSVAAGPAPKQAAPTAITKVSLLPTKPFRFGKAPPKHQSRWQTAWICFTPAGACHVPGLGFCCCNFWNGAMWVQYCGST